MKKKTLNRIKKHSITMGGVVSVTPANSGAVCTVDIFGETGLANAIKKLGWKIKNSSIIDGNDKPIKCSICEDNLNSKNLSAFFPSSLEQVCEKPECFITAIFKAKKYEK